MFELPLYLTLDDVKALALRDKDQAILVMESFAQKLLKDPSSAMDWAQHEYRATATLDVANRVLDRLKHDGVTLNDIVTYLFQEALRGAAYPKESTSPCANLLATYRTAAYACMLRSILGM